AAMDLPTTEVDGMDAWAVRAAANGIVARVRAGGGPEFVEARTYRFVGHSRSDPGAYRPPGELDRWRERDPLVVAESRLRETYAFADDELERISRDADEELDRVEAAALAASFPASLETPEFRGG